MADSEPQVLLSPDTKRALEAFSVSLHQSIKTQAFQDFSRSLASVQEQAVRAIASPAFEAMQQISRTVAAIAMPDFTAPIREALEGWQRSIRPMLEQFAESAERLRPLLESLGRYPEAMAFYGWPPLDDLPMPDVYWIVQQYDSRLATAAVDVDRRVTDAYGSGRTSQLLADWEGSTLLARQAPILRDAVQAHLDGQYNLSVPALLLCVEAVAVTLVKPRNGRLGKAQRESLVAATFAEESRTGDLERATLRATANLFNTMLYGTWFHGDPIPAYLNRHAVLHGGDLEYGDQANSLRAILLLDLLQQQYVYFSLHESQVFHRKGCPRVRRLTTPAKHHLSEAAAAAQGLRPCRTCMKEN